MGVGRNGYWMATTQYHWTGCDWLMPLARLYQWQPAIAVMIAITAQTGMTSFLSGGLRH